MIKSIDGVLFESMMKNGLANLQKNEELLNKLNVFPVPDADTGTNMVITLEGGVKAAIRSADVNMYLKGLSEGMLYAARGNSGVILSQFFSGVYLKLARYRTINIGHLRNALIYGYQHAYAAVDRSVEGTILSIMREGIENIKTHINRETTLEMLLSFYLAEMKKTLAKTPDVLSALKEANVVDSGACGFIIIVEGMLKSLYGEKIDFEPVTRDIKNVSETSLKIFNEYSLFEDGYCMEFVLQLMHSKSPCQYFDRAGFSESLKGFGDSIVAVQDRSRVKIHIHTHKPEKIIEIARQYGEFISVKIENMQIQHNEGEFAKQNEYKEGDSLGIVVVVTGEELKNVFSGLGCGCVINGDASMSVNVSQFDKAIRSIKAKRIVILPSSKSNADFAQKAVAEGNYTNVTVIPTYNIAESYFAMAMDISDEDDVDFRIKQMSNGAKGLNTLTVTRAVDDCMCDGIECKKGDNVVSVKQKVMSAGLDLTESVIDAIDKIDGIKDMDTCVIFRGSAMDNEDESKLITAVAKKHPMLECVVVCRDLTVCDCIIGLI